MRRLRHILWMAPLACAGMLLVLYAVLPILAATVLQHFLSQHGYAHVTVQLGYPGWHALDVPLLTFQADSEAEILSVSIRDSRIEYDLWTLLSGRIERLTISEASVSWRRRGGQGGQPCVSDQTANTGSGRLAQLTVGQLVPPVPALPVRALVIRHAHVFRDCATGPLRDVLLAATVQQTVTVTEGHVALRSTSSAAYRLQFAVTDIGALTATLHAEPVTSEAIARVQAHVRRESSEIQWVGQVNGDFARLAPFLALILPLGAELQSVAGIVQATWTVTAPSTSTPTTVWHEPATQLSGTVALTLQLPHLTGLGDHLAVQLDTEVTGNMHQLTWTLAKGSHLSMELARSALPLPSGLSWLPPGQEHHVVLECLEALRGHLKLTESPLQFQVEGPLRLRYGTLKTPLQLEAVVHHLTGQGTEPLTAAGTYHLQGAVHHVPPALLAVQQGQWDLRGTFTLDALQVQGSVEASSFVRLQGMHTAALSIPTSMGQLTKPLRLKVDMQTGDWTAGPAHVALQIPQAVWQDATVSMAHAQLTLHALRGDQEHWQATGALQLTDVSPRLPTAALPTMQWDVDFSADDTALRLDTTSTAFGAAWTLASRAEYHWTAHTGAVHLQLRPVQFDAAHVAWRAVMPLPSFPAAVTGGRVSATALLTWGPESALPASRPVLRSGHATLMLEQLSGHYQGILIEGLSTTVSLYLTNAHTLTMPAPARVTIATIHTGVEVTDVSLALQLGWESGSALPWLAVRQVRAAVFGGELKSAGLHLDLAQLDQTFTVQVGQLDLQQLLQVERQQGLEGTGLLDGFIPIRLTPTGVQVHAGKLAARPPGGVLRYQPTSEAAQERAPSDTSLSQVLQALSDFHYQVLTVGVQYEMDGTLKLAVRLEGQNPSWQQGQPVHFNLNVEDNIPKLLQSLRIAQGIEHVLEEHLQRR